VTVLDTLDADAVRRWCDRGVAALGAARTSIDDLNVYPVPDGDTGTNLLLTMTAAADAAREAGADGGGLPAVVRAMARGALLGARGNSGAILAQLLRGVADVLAAGDPAGGPELRAALCRAADLARASVEVPVEGTVLTVARAAADAAAAAEPASLAAVARAAAAGGAAALARTPSQLEVLAAAGVVDAGGRGLCVLLDALVATVTGEPVTGDATGGPVPHGLPPLPVPRDRSGVAAREAGSPAYAYEVQYVLALPPHADDAALVGRLRQRLAGLGDSLVVVGGEGLWAVHVHVDDVGAAIEAGLDAGTPSRITVTRFADQTVPAPPVPGPPVTGPPAAGSAERALPEPVAATGDPVATRSRCTVAVVRGDGLARLVRASGAEVLQVAPGESPGVEELLAVLLAGDARDVVLLPADSEGHSAAFAAAQDAGRAGRTVTVVPVRSLVQSLAALAVADPARSLADDAVAMSAAAAATRWAAVEAARVRAQTSAGVCESGDVLGLVEGDVVLIGPDVAGVARGLLDRMLLAGGELVTLVTGDGVPEGLADGLGNYLRAVHPGLDVVAYAGGPADVALLLGVE
jgi:DAK2 domain fusion protein YloV